MKLALTLCLCFCSASAAWPQTASTHTIVGFDVPGAGHGKNQGTVGYGIVADGSIVGWYYDSNSVPHGFFRSSDGQITTFDPPGSVGTYPRGLNSAHAAVGQYVDSAGVMHGFLRFPSGTIITFDAPGAGAGVDQGTVLGNVTTHNGIAGYYLDSNSTYHGFLRSPGGKLIEFEAPGAGKGPFQGTQVQNFEGLTDGGVVAGSYLDSKSGSHGFLRAANGAFTEFDPPGSIGTYVASINSQQTIAGIYVDLGGSHGFLRTADGAITSFGNWSSFGVSTINVLGAVTGYYFDSQLVAHGFLRAPSGSITSFDAPGAGTASNQGTFAFANDASGQITGYYVDSIGVYHGFVVQ